MPERDKWKENKYTGGFRTKFGYDVDDNGYLIPCEKEQSIIRLMKLLRKKGKSYKQISEIVTKSTRKKFVQSWVFNILKRETSEQRAAWWNIFVQNALIN